MNNQHLTSPDPEMILVTSPQPTKGCLSQPETTSLLNTQVSSDNTPFKTPQGRKTQRRCYDDITKASPEISSQYNKFYLLLNKTVIASPVCLRMQDPHSTQENSPRIENENSNEEEKSL